MGFTYDKLKKKEGDGHTNWWTSYADLFMMMSVVFLLMYVTASLRSGAAGYMQQRQYEKVSQENADLKEQIKVYNTLKDQQLSQASDDEQKVYSKLMDKLKLLQDEANEERESLEQQAKENADKAFAINQYQQIIRNIINANILAKAQIKRREEIIESKSEALTEKEHVITNQEAIIHQKEKMILENEAKITDIKQKLNGRITQLKSLQKQAKLTKNEMEKRISKLRTDSSSQIAALSRKSHEAEQELQQVRGDLTSTSIKLNEAEDQKSALTEKLEKSRSSYIAQIERMRAKHNAQLKAERKAFQSNLESQNLSAAAKAKQLSEFAKKINRKAKALEGELEGLSAKVRDTDAKLANAEQEKGRALATVAGLKRENASIQNDLEKARSLANARKNLALAIDRAFKKAGIHAAVDSKTGIATLDFGDEYFDTDRAELKPAMREKLNKFFPTYTDSLFNTPQLANKIANVEIIGFASSTYRGRYVNPQSVKPEDKEAVEYNLKLSFSRANEIFKYVYSKSTLTERQKKKLLPLIKVVGRGYLPEGMSAADIPEGISESDFCTRYNCKKAQRVVVKFNLKD